MAFYSTALTVDGQRISYLHYNGSRRKLVIIAPGFFNSLDTVLLQKLKDTLIESYDVAMFDFRGHGRSSGLFTWTSREHLDIEAVLSKVGRGYERIGIVGFSTGAASAMRLSVEHDGIDCMVLVSTPVSAGLAEFRFWNLNFDNDIAGNMNEGMKGKGVRPGPFWMAKKRPIDLAPKIACPVYFMHGQKDWVSEYRQSEMLYERVPGPKKISIIKNGLHAEYLLRGNYDETTWLMKEWLSQVL